MSMDRIWNPIGTPTMRPTSPGMSGLDMGGLDFPFRVDKRPENRTSEKPAACGRMKRRHYPFFGAPVQHRKSS
jgi:hypothetical protein